MLEVNASGLAYGLLSGCGLFIRAPHTPDPVTSNESFRPLVHPTRAHEPPWPQSLAPDAVPLSQVMDA